ncbi:MAG TPA: PAS domain S-box protein [bacterium]|nr:PAS domain S-box protein [bacterium]
MEKQQRFPGFFEVDGEGRFLQANFTTLEMFGYTEEDLQKGVTIFDVLEKQEHQRAYQKLKQTLEGTLSGPEIYLARRKDGSSFHILVDAVASGQPGLVTLRGLVVEAAAFAHERQMLQQITLFYREIVECSPVGVYQTTLEGNWLFANDAACRLLGFSSPAELVRHPTPTLYRNPRDREKLIELLKKHGQVKNFETQILRADGQVITISVFAVLHGQTISGTFIDITDRYQAQQQLRAITRQQEQLIQDIIYSISRMLEVRDPYTASHQVRMTDLACLIGRELGFPEERVRPIFFAALVHDVGKIGVPSQILTKIGPLNSGEITVLRTHPVISHRILSPIHFPWPIARIVVQHHERLDGSGYPQGLRGDSILPEARILAVADVVEAMSSQRPYRPALSCERALSEITANRGIKYDPQVVDACLSVIKKGLFSLEGN